MPRTSDKSELILEFVSNFIQENGYAPSVREIGAGVGLRSTASVSYHLRALQDKGLLQGGESPLLFSNGPKLLYVPNAENQIYPLPLPLVHQYEIPLP